MARGTESQALNSYLESLCVLVDGQHERGIVVQLVFSTTSPMIKIFKNLTGCDDCSRQIHVTMSVLDCNTIALTSLLLVLWEQTEKYDNEDMKFWAGAVLCYEKKMDRIAAAMREEFSRKAKERSMPLFGMLSKIRCKAFSMPWMPQ